MYFSGTSRSHCVHDAAYNARAFRRSGSIGSGFHEFFGGADCGKIAFLMPIDQCVPNLLDMVHVVGNKLSGLRLVRLAFAGDAFVILLAHVRQRFRRTDAIADVLFERVENEQGGVGRHKTELLAGGGDSRLRRIVRNQRRDQHLTVVRAEQTAFRRVRRVQIEAQRLLFAAEFDDDVQLVAAFWQKARDGELAGFETRLAFIGYVLAVKEDGRDGNGRRIEGGDGFVKTERAEVDDLSASLLRQSAETGDVLVAVLENGVDLALREIDGLQIRPEIVQSVRAENDIRVGWCGGDGGGDVGCAIERNLADGIDKSLRRVERGRLQRLVAESDQRQRLILREDFFKECEFGIVVGLVTGGGSVPQDNGRRFLRGRGRRFDERVNGEIAIAVRGFFGDGALERGGHDGDVQIFRKGDVLQFRFGDVEVLP